MHFHARGHVITWAVGGVDAVEVLLLTEQWWGLPARVYTPSRGWADADMDAAMDRLQRRGLMTDGEQLTRPRSGSVKRSRSAPDELERPLLDALGDDLDELLEHLDPWSEAISAPAPTRSESRRSTEVYNVGAGPHFGSRLTIDTAEGLYKNKASPCAQTDRLSKQYTPGRRRSGQRHSLRYIVRQPTRSWQMRGGGRVVGPGRPSRCHGASCKGPKAKHN